MSEAIKEALKNNQITELFASFVQEKFPNLMPNDGSLIVYRDFAKSSLILISADFSFEINVKLG